LTEPAPTNITTIMKTAVVVLAIVAAVAEGAPQYWNPTSFRNSLFSSPAFTRVSNDASTLNSAIDTINSAIGTIKSAVPYVDLPTVSSSGFAATPTLNSFPAVAAPAVAAPAVAAVPAGVKVSECPNYPFCAGFEVSEAVPSTQYTSHPQPINLPRSYRQDCKQIKDIQYNQVAENECETVTEEKCYFNTVYKNRCMEETEEVCEEKCDDDGKNCEVTDDCQELMKTVCGEVAEPEEVCNDVKKQECQVVNKKKPQQVTRTICPEDPEWEQYQEDEDEEEEEGEGEE